MVITYIDRSRMKAYKACPRLRFLEYHCQGTGIRLSKENIFLSTGSAIHQGIELLLRGESVYCFECGFNSTLLQKGINCPICEKDSKYIQLAIINDIDSCVKVATHEYTKLISKKELELDKNENQLFVMQEQRALIEGLIRAFYIVHYPILIDEYEVLDTEREIELELADGLVLMSRPDSVFRDKATQGLVVYSLKSSASWKTDTNELQNKYDDQGISELITSEAFYGEEVEAILMNFVIKGQRMLMGEAENKVKLQNSFIVHPYMLDGIGQQFSIKYTKAKGWKRVNIWEEMPVRDWIEILEKDYFEELKGTVVNPYPYNRSTEDIKNWREQNVYQELEIAKHLDELRQLEPSLPGIRESQLSYYQTLLNRYFPQTRNACFSYGKTCQFVMHCWEGVRSDSVEYEARQAHHKPEQELFQIKLK